MFFERCAGPVLRVVQNLQTDANRLEAFRHEFDALAAAYFQDNCIRQDYLMTRGVKV